jgi:restriction system protein
MTTPEVAATVGSRRRRLFRRLAMLKAQVPELAPAVVLKAVLDFGGATDDGRLVRAVAVPWFEFMRMLQQDPASLHHIDPFKLEEIIAGAYKREGFDEVILTPRSGDKGRDVVATKWGVGSIRIFDQVKAYSPGHLVPATEVREMIGVITGAQNVSKGIITTTSEFAPRVRDDPYIKPFLPYRLELKPRHDLLAWLAELSTP